MPDSDKQVTTKHVESPLVPRLDEGSNPSTSTIPTGNQPPTKRWGNFRGKNTEKRPFRGAFLVLYMHSSPIYELQTVAKECKLLNCAIFWRFFLKRKEKTMRQILQIQKKCLTLHTSKPNGDAFRQKIRQRSLERWQSGRLRRS